MPLYAEFKKTLGSFSLNVSLDAKKEAVALLGASGCGKSMTLKCIAGIEKPDSGRIVLDGKVLFDSEKKINLPPQKRRVGYLFQNYALFPNMTVEENIAAGIFLPKRAKGKIVAEKIKAFYLDGLEKRYPTQLSGGQQQRTALARILASDPDILMLDEPFSALDSYLRGQLEQEMFTVLQEFAGTTLYVSHNRDEVYRLCDRIAVLSDGMFEPALPKWELFDCPPSAAAARLTGCKNISRARKTGENQVEALDWGISFTTHLPVPEDVAFVGIRAHYFQFSKDSQNVNAFAYEIIREIEDTFSVILQLRPYGIPGAMSIRWEIAKNDWNERNPKPKYLQISPEKILLFRR